ncbi:serine/threonine protein kinase [Streptosporangium sp. CA-135522]|uniref:serine/threonine protein kinase n=1 Tax=Streptosporangium sp. CA-135522 TaxID=3240072 RepID=UPI003D8B9F4E
MDLVIGPYRVVSKLGQGRTGEVFLARDPDGRQVAVKVIHPGLAADPAFRQRFQQEAQAATRVARSCTAPVLGVRLDGDHAYLVTEYVEGPNLRHQVGEHGPLSGSSLETLAVSTAVALQAVHAAGLVHRNLRPSAVLLGPLGPRVIGFGVAHLAGPAALPSLSTPGYTSPEQARGQEATTASDVFAWGGVVLYAATGREPSGSGADGTGDPALAGLHGPLRDLAAHALSLDPARRPSVQDILRILTGAIDPATSLVQPPAVEPLDEPTNPAIPIARPPAAAGPVAQPIGLPAPMAGPAAQPPGVPPGQPPSTDLLPARPADLPVPVGASPAPQWPSPAPGAGRPNSAAAAGAAPAHWKRSVAVPLLAGLAVALVIAAFSFFLPRDRATSGQASPAQPIAGTSSAVSVPDPAADSAATPVPAADPTVTGSPSALVTSSPSPSSAKAAVTPSPTRALPFQDDFSGANRGWTTAAGGSGKHRPARGAYRIVTRSDGYLPVIAPLTGPVKNTIITAKVRMLNGKGDFGVFCRGLDKGSKRYAFSLASNGNASISKSGEAPASVKQVRVPGFDPARLTVLRAACRSGAAGTRLTLSVNGKEVVSRLDDDRPFAAGSIGMFAHAWHGGVRMDVSFDSFDARP